MKRRIVRQQGSAHIIIIIVLVLVFCIIGLLGFVLWQNFFSGKTASTSNSTTQSATATDSTSDLSETYTSSVGLFSIHYPTSWALATGDSSSEAEDATLTSPSGTVLQIGANSVGGRGGSC